MTISIPAPPPLRGGTASPDVVVRMLTPGSSARERLLVVEGGIGCGKTHALTTAAAAARAAGHEVIEVRPDRGDPVISASSSLSSRRSSDTSTGCATARRGRARRSAPS
ncbi:hypothetical protein Q0F99_04775 [Rathayibacter oskolensis]|uniref:hypothetical protein n=1 Tax=Rathayibacter oskolensis TaxID=1891671 RepID=UPI00266021D5|nr:hypothetical protein [Rathayibacter oskolensis]WKK72308.1 hypothetical protein Q0F99_04775 [Rathayibacter oskolensis]